MDRRTIIWTMQLDDGSVYGGTVMAKPPGFSEKFNPSHRLTNFEYTRAREKKGSMKFSFYNEDLLYFSSPVLMKGTPFDFSFGYPEETSEVYSAVVTAVSGFREIQVEAALQENEFSYLPKARKWENKSRSEIANAIAKENAFTLMDIDQVQEKTTFVQDNQTDREFLLSLAEKVNFVVFTRFENGSLCLHFHAKRKDERPFWKLTWRGGQGNMINFNITENNILGVPGEVEVQGYDPDTREEVKGKANKAQQKSLAQFKEVLAISGVTGETFDAFLKSKDAMQKVKSVLPKPVADALDAQLQADAVDEMADEEVIKATVNLVGEPRFEAGYVIELSGLPPMLAGNWWVEGLKHTFGTGGFLTELTLTRDSMGLLPTPADEWNAAAGFPNKKKATEMGINLEAVEAIDTVTGETYRAFLKESK